MTTPVDPIALLLRMKNEAAAAINECEAKIELMNKDLEAKHREAKELVELKKVKQVEADSFERVLRVLEESRDPRLRR